VTDSSDSPDSGPVVKQSKHRFRPSKHNFPSR
jgi:hypothetical protein